MKRFIITLLIVAVAAVFVISMAANPGNRPADEGSPGNGNAITPAPPPAPATNQTAKAPGDPPQEPAGQTAPPVGNDPPAEKPADDKTAGQPAPADPPTAPAAAAPWKQLKIAPIEQEMNPDLEVLGSTDKDSEYKMKAEISRYGASIYRIQLSDYKTALGSTDPLTILQNPYPEHFAADPKIRWLGAFSAERVTVKPAGINITPTDVPLGTEIDDGNGGTEIALAQWAYDGNRSDGIGKYWIDIVDEKDEPILRITRTYTLSNKGVEGYDIECRQEFKNLTDKALDVTFAQHGQVELAPGDDSYLGDRRLFIAGYHDMKSTDPAEVATDDTIARAKILDRMTKAKGPRLAKLLWNPPPEESSKKLVWIAATNRYFTAAIHRIVPVDPAKGQDVVVPTHLQESFPDVGLGSIGQMIPKGPDYRRAYVTLASRVMTIEAGETDNLDIAMYAGPRDKAVLSSRPFVWFSFSDNLVIYLAGCTMCTSQSVAHALIWFLRTIYSFLGDWGIAIIVLVLCVRLLLHPLTKKSQVSMMKMGKQMQALKPEIDKLKKKYPDNPQKVQQEQAKLFREKGVNPLNMLGCLPMFLQMPIWVALFAMLSAAIELRHQPAFYGVFQKITGGRWPFLEDLASQDNFIPLAKWGWDFHLIPQSIWAGAPHVTAINLLPILMMAVFVINQKLTTPPATDDQTRSQQKMMRIMTMIFPIFLYKAPCGLTLYILSSTFAGIVDSTIVRRHIKREEEAGTLLQVKEPGKRGGCMGGKLAEAMEARQKAMMEAKNKASNQGGTGGNYKRRKSRK